METQNMERRTPAGEELTAGPGERVKVSVCIASYNYGRFIGEAIRSVLAQSAVDFELIVCDDQSTDDSEVVIQSFNDPRLRYHRNPVRLGNFGNNNRGVALSRGQYICFLDADDVMLPGNLATKSQFLDQHPEVGLVHSAAQSIDQHGTIRSTVAEAGEESKMSPRDAVAALLFDNPVLSCSAVMIRRECWDELGGFDPIFTHSGDYALWIKIAARHHLGFIATPLVSIRRHGDNCTSQAIPDGRAERETLVVIERAFQDLPAAMEDLAALKSRAVATTSLRFVAYYLALGETSRACASFRRAVNLEPGLAAADRALTDVLFRPSVDPLISDRLDYVRRVFTFLEGEYVDFARLRPSYEARCRLERVYAALNRNEPARSYRHDLYHALRADPGLLRNRGLRSLLVRSLLAR